MAWSRDRLLKALGVVSRFAPAPQDDGEYVDRYKTDCVVETTFRIAGTEIVDDSGIVSPARPIDARAIEQIRNQQIARLAFDEAAVHARERRIALSRGRVIEIRARRA